MTNLIDGRLELPTDKNCVLALVDYQAAIFKGVASGDKTIIKNAAKRASRKKVVISGLWTSMCFACSALHALKEGLEVYGLIDAAGDSTPDAHKYGVERMLQAGVVPITLE
jgi:nicotinamidase-related amidase